VSTEGPRCEMFCDRPLDNGADPPDPDFKNCCSNCRAELSFVCSQVLPAIRRHGYCAPPGANEDEQLRAMVDQVDARPRLRDAMRFIDNVPTVDGGRLADMWTDERWPSEGTAT
jgi:hypothetical protein